MNPAHGLSCTLPLYLFPVQTRGRSAPRPRSASPRPSSRTPTPSSAAPSYSYGSASAAPAASAPAGGLSAEQQAFLSRKAAESRSPAPVEVRQRSALRRLAKGPHVQGASGVCCRPLRSPISLLSSGFPQQPSLPECQPAHPAPSPPANRLQTRGRSAPRPRSASPRPSSRTPAPAAASSASYSSYSAPAASAAPATSGLSAEQAAFMQRKAAESRSPAPVEVRTHWVEACAAGWRPAQLGLQGAWLTMRARINPCKAVQLTPWVAAGLPCATPSLLHLHTPSHTDPRPQRAPPPLRLPPPLVSHPHPGGLQCFLQLLQPGPGGPRCACCPRCARCLRPER